MRNELFLLYTKAGCLKISIIIRTLQKYSFKKLHCHGTYKNHAKPFSQCILKSIAFVNLQFKKEVKKASTMFNVSLPKGSSMFLELCYSLSDISDAFQPSIR